MIADYDNKYEFNKFYLIDIKKGKKETITSNQSISIDSYVQGSYKNDIYLFDKNNKIQYQINIKTKSFSLILTCLLFIQIRNIFLTFSFNFANINLLLKTFTISL